MIVIDGSIKFPDWHFILIIKKSTDGETSDGLKLAYSYAEQQD